MYRLQPTCLQGMWDSEMPYLLQTVSITQIGLDLLVRKRRVHLHCNFWVISLRARSLGFPGCGASNLTGYWPIKNDTIFVRTKNTGDYRDNF